MTKSNYRKISYDVIIIASPKNVTKLTSQDLSILGLPLIKISGYASVWLYYKSKLELKSNLSEILSVTVICKVI